MLPILYLIAGVAYSTWRLKEAWPKVIKKAKELEFTNKDMPLLKGLTGIAWFLLVFTWPFHWLWRIFSDKYTTEEL